MNRKKNATDTYEPDLTIYAGGDATWIRNLTIPDNIIVTSEIEGLLIKSKATKPERIEWHGQVQYKDFPKPEDFISNVKASVTLWVKGIELGYNVASVGRDGYFSLALSGQEYIDLCGGKSHLTITVGNWLAKPKKEDILFPAMMLGTKDTVKPLQIPRPDLYYYGRILFEDGAPPILDPVPWPGAEINISFPYAGQVSLDKQGCFKVFLTDDQLEALKLRKQRKNIYIPSYTKKNRATAKYIFPVTVLTKDKSNPGTVKIPRPKASAKETP